MGLAELQNALASLYTHAESRRAWSVDRAAITRQFNLTDEDASQLLAMTSDSIERFARSLAVKRKGEVFGLLPLTAKALKQDAKGNFESFWSQRRSKGVSSREDAINFVNWLQKSRSDLKIPIWIINLARMESASVRARLGKGRLQLLLLSFHPRDLMLATHSIVRPPPTSRRCLLICWRGWRTCQFHQMVIWLPWRGIRGTCRSTDYD